VGIWYDLLNVDLRVEKYRSRAVAVSLLQDMGLTHIFSARLIIDLSPYHQRYIV